MGRAKWPVQAFYLETLTTRSTTKSSRLFFLINENLVADIISADIEPGYRTDHSAVTITFRFTERARGRTFWKFNSSLLKDKEYVRRIKDS